MENGGMENGGMENGVMENGVNGTGPHEQETENGDVAGGLYRVSP